MGFGDTSLLCKIVLNLMILCVISNILGFVIPYWYSKEYAAVNYETYDLFWLQAVRAFAILACVLFLSALVFIIVFMFFLSHKKILYLVAVCLSFVGAFCAFIAFAVYAGKAKDTLKEYHAAFTLTSVAFGLGLINGILGIIDYNLTAAENRRHSDQ